MSNAQPQRTSPTERRDYGRPVNILLVEDNLGDIRLAQEAFKQAHITVELQIALDAELARSLLRRSLEPGGPPRPDVVLLDLNLPRGIGRQVLDLIKTSPELTSIPVIILSTSRNPDHIQECYRNHANCYIIKPDDLGLLQEVFENIEEFWLSLAKLPSV